MMAAICAAPAAAPPDRDERHGTGVSEPRRRAPADVRSGRAALLQPWKSSSLDRRFRCSSVATVRDNAPALLLLPRCGSQHRGEGL
jgi:hypothetical protein